MGGLKATLVSGLISGGTVPLREMALCIGKAFGVKMDTLMRMRSACEIAQTREREKLIRVQRVRRAA